MPHFMVSCNYSAESKNAMIANPVDRTKAASAAVEAVGGKLHSAFIASDVVSNAVVLIDENAPEAPSVIASFAGYDPNEVTSHRLQRDGRIGNGARHRPDVI